MPDERIPAECFPPGEFIAEEMEARGWDMDDLVANTTLNPTRCAAILEGRQVLTPLQAHCLGEAFDTSAQFWLNLQQSYIRWKLEMKRRARESPAACPHCGQPMPPPAQSAPPPGPV